MSSDDPDRTSAREPESDPNATLVRPAEQSAAAGSSVVPGYEIVGTLGRGGMGVVYKATQAGLNRVVALKMLLAGPFADPSLRARFLLEAESVAALEHPGIVKVFAFGENGDHPFLAMEYVPGGTLADRIRWGNLSAKFTSDATNIFEELGDLIGQGGPLPPREAASLLAKLADAVAHAHSRGVVHRDIKPLNVLLTAEGEPRLTDFGLAKVGRADQHLSVTGQVLGTPAYMAPEQAAGRVREIGTAADIYALGAVLYDMLTARPPFKGDSVAVTLQQVLTAIPERPRKLNAAVPRDLETICLKCLEKDPANRYATADALTADLRAYLGGFPISARPVWIVGRAWKWAKRHPARAGGFVALLAVGLAAGVVVPLLPKSPPVAPAASTRPGVWVERDSPTEATLGLVGLQAIVFKSSGGPVDFWLEFSTGGQPAEQLRTPPVRGVWPADGNIGQQTNGLFIWTRRRVDLIGETEEWHIIYKWRNNDPARAEDEVVAFAKSAGVERISTHRIGARKVENTRALRSDTRFANPLPADGPICLFETTESAYAPNTQEETGNHHIRVMGRVIGGTGLK